MEWSLSIKEPKDRTEEKYQEYTDKCDALEAMRLDTLKQNALNAGYTEDEIEVRWATDEEWATIEQANRPKPTYADLRRAEYPPIGDQLDAIFKGEPYFSEMKKVVMAVKEKYPADSEI
jgi:hypothetical protein